jgi:hypothetical protein
MIVQRLEDYPYPVAHPAWLFRQADGVADKLEKAGHFVELTAATLGILALAWCEARSIEPGGVRQWQKKLDPGGITLDVWNGAIRATSKEMMSFPNDPIAQSFRAAANPTVPALEAYRPMRNIYAHGGKPRLPSDQQATVEDLTKSVSLILDRIEPLTHLGIGVVRSCRPRGTTFFAEVEVMSGFAEPFAVQRFSAKASYAPGTVIVFNNGSMDHAFELAPYCIRARCPQCGRDELFYLHQHRKGNYFYFSFSTGHELKMRGDKVTRATKPQVALGMMPLGSVRSAASAGWRASWADLASRPRRLAARLLDTIAALLIAGLGWMDFLLLGLPTWPSAGLGLLLLCLYEPVSVLTGGSPGKRLTRIEPISTWDNRTLSRGDALRRALYVDLQLLFPPLAVKNLAWLLWDPARQCLHDLRAASIVISGRSKPAQKL